jgi:hypothetical protein
MIDCYRDPSVLQFCAVAISDGLHSLAAGRLREAARQIFNGRNLESLRCVFEERKWISEF